MIQNGNGHSNGNGNGHKNGWGDVNSNKAKNLQKLKNINIKAKKGLTNGDVQAAAVKADASPTKMAKILHIKKSTAHQYLQKPEIKKLVLDAREKALKASGLSLTKAFKRVDEALDAKQTFFGKTIQAADHDIRLKAAKLTAELHHVVKDEGGGAHGPIVVMPVVVIEGKPLMFKVGNNGSS